MNKKQLRRKLMDSAQVDYRQVYQKRPYTMVRVKVHWGGLAFENVSFSKVCYPDKWDPEKGVRIATQKAIAEAVRTRIQCSEAVGTLDLLEREALNG